MNLTPEYSHTILPRALSSKSLRGLERKFQDLQFKTLKQYHIVNVYFDTEKKEHVIWYFENINITKEITKETQT